VDVHTSHCTRPAMNVGPNGEPQIAVGAEACPASTTKLPC